MVKKGTCQEVTLRGEVVRVGEKICFPCLVGECETATQTYQYIMRQTGKGPFDLLGVEVWERVNNPFFKLIFISNNGMEKNITSGYFVKYHEPEEKPLGMHGNECAHCDKENAEYNALIWDLYLMHNLNVKDPEILCSASFSDFDIGHPKYSDLGNMKLRLYYLANKNDLPWAREKAV